MDPKAENVVQNIGAIAETISIFYNSMARQVPKDVALALTRHFMDITITQRQKGLSPEVRIAIQNIAAQAQRRAAEERKRKAEQAKAQEPPKEETPEPPSPREEQTQSDA